MNAVSRNLRELVESRELKRSALAGVAGASVGAVSKWFSGEKEPRRKYLDAIASYYLVSIDDLTSERHGLYAQAHELTDAPAGAIAPNPEPRSAHAPLLGRQFCRRFPNRQARRRSAQLTTSELRLSSAPERRRANGATPSAPSCGTLRNAERPASDTTGRSL